MIVHMHLKLHLSWLLWLHNLVQDCCTRHRWRPEPLGTLDKKQSARSSCAPKGRTGGCVQAFKALSRDTLHSAGRLPKLGALGGVCGAGTVSACFPSWMAGPVWALTSSMAGFEASSGLRNEASASSAAGKHRGASSASKGTAGQGRASSLQVGK